MRNKDKTKNTFLPHLPSQFQLDSFTSDSSTSYNPSQWHRRMGNGGWGQTAIISLLLLPPHAFLLLQHGSSAWTTVLQEKTAPAWARHGLQLPSEHIHPLRRMCPPPWAAVCIFAPTWCSPQASGTTCIVVFFMGCGGISALVPGSPSPPSSSLTLISAGLFLSLFFSPLSLTAAAQHFFTLF